MTGMNETPECVEDTDLDQVLGGSSWGTARSGPSAQSDLDNGRLIARVGVAPVKPAEFVLFRIGQKTADARS